MQGGLKRPRRGYHLVQMMNEEGGPKHWQWMLGARGRERDVGGRTCRTWGLCLRVGHKCGIVWTVDFGFGRKMGVFLFYKIGNTRRADLGGGAEKEWILFIMNLSYLMAESFKRRGIWMLFWSSPETAGIERCESFYFVSVKAVFS